MCPKMAKLYSGAGLLLYARSHTAHEAANRADRGEAENAQSEACRGAASFALRRPGAGGENGPGNWIGKL